ncbi:uncharacterized protein LOC141595923 [Silene latifolia]|uniref:uncharacterized protein LOC141595923 n=1 Tax=Silene latifolia TaxID=37657 RepID=UPI003D77DDA8
MAMKVEAFQRLISEVEKKELEDLKHSLYKPDESDPENVEIYPSLFISYNYDAKKSTPSYFQVQRYSQDYLFLEKIDKDDVQRCIRSKTSNTFKYELAWLLSNHPGYDIWDGVKKAAERIGDSELYQKTIRGVATLIMALYSSETLCRLHHFRAHHTQSIKLWEQIKQPNTPYIPAFCNAFTLPNINYNHYPLVTQADTDEFISHYYTGCLYDKNHPIRARYASLPPPQRKKNDVFKEIHEVVAKMESPKRRKGDLDDYTRLLMKLASVNSWGKENELADRVMAVINPSCEDWKMIMRGRVLCMIKTEEWRIQGMSSKVSGTLHHLVYDSEKCAHDPCLVYGNQLCADAPRVLVCTDIWDVIEVAQFRCEALGSRFIKRNHLLWAFYELGFGLPTEILAKFNLNIEDEDRPRPPYHIYLASMKLAKSLGNEIVQLQHFIFAVLFLEDIADDKNLVTKMMKEQFTEFLRAAALDSVTRPNDNARSWLKKVHESTHVN